MDDRTEPQGTYPGWHLAQVNIALMRAPLDDPLMQRFVDQLDFINALADRSPGFVWRLQTEEGDATAVRAYDDERILFNLSLWESIGALHDYVYRSAHLEVLKDRKLWFEVMQDRHMALWWVPAGHVPGVEEARDRLEHLQHHGPTAEAFTFQRRFAPPTAGHASA
ncbi:MAG TPA: DUF3291 domain-containing protein [bacterium]|nr:DUF3291 domain-containing protein [bacterium]